jgi:hypothetical protein
VQFDAGKRRNAESPALTPESLREGKFQDREEQFFCFVLISTTEKEEFKIGRNYEQ